MKKRIYLFLLCTLQILAQENNIQSSATYQEELNSQFADSLKSPLTKEDLQDFKGLDFFPIDEKYIVSAKFIRLKNQKPFEMPTTTDRKPMYIKYGELHFTIDEKEMVLLVYQNIELSKRKGFKDYLFLPFLDITNGNETYGGGRFLDMKIPKNKKVIIDFNKAYNPYCAYNHKYSCPIVPLENELPIAIKAGVKKFHE